VFMIVYYESRKRDLKTRPTYDCRCDERLKTKSEKSTRLTYTGLLGELESIFSVIRKAAALARVLSTFPFRVVENTAWWK
jgi:hypothetical protein